MALIKQIRANEKAHIKIAVSKNLADTFNKQLEIYNQNNGSNHVLDFDPLIKKLTNELTKLNAEDITK